MEQLESHPATEQQGHLVVERTGAGWRVLFADPSARKLTCLEPGAPADWADLSLRQLDLDRQPLDESHQLWQIGKSADKQAFLQANAALEAALRSAEEANQAKSRFLSSMSHDIRTPMNAIVGMTAIGLSHIDEKARVQDCLSKIQTASSHLMSLVNDVLDMSRIDSGRMTLHEERFSLADLIHDVAVILRPQAAQKQQTLRVEIGDILEEHLLGDPLRLRQILVNIIGNAIKYTQAGGEIQTSFAQRPAQAQRGGASVLLDFSCQDNGIGMSQAFLQRIFLPFERVNNTTISRIEGTGLGMSIVKKLVDSMSGEISVQSQEGQGSLFQVSIPLPVSPQTQNALALPTGGTILVAESWEDRAEKIHQYLTEADLRPVTLPSGMDAVTWLTEAQYENRMPLALLLGQELTDMPTLNLASHVRQLAGQAFPILLASEADWVQLEYRATRAGINAFVPCPLFRSRLLKTLSDLTGGSNGQTGGQSGEIDYSGYRVLLVEDNELNQEIAMELLEMTGVQVETAGDGLQAAEKFEASPPGYYDLIFMDIQMPVMDGYQATRRIRQLAREDAKTVWIVAMTANAFVEDMRLSQEAGMNEHLSKPVDIDRLNEILRGRLGAAPQPGKQ